MFTQPFKVTIPDGNAGGATATLNVSGYVGTMTGFKFRFDGSACSNTAGSTTVGIDHTWVGDLTVTLTSPAGTTVTLMNHPGGTNNSGNNFCGTVLDDAALTSINAITANAAPFTGQLVPDHLVSTTSVPDSLAPRQSR